MPSHLRTRPLIAALLFCTASGSACARQELSDWPGGDDNSESWLLFEGEPELHLEGSPLIADWSGPSHYGGCIDEGSWQSYLDQGNFVQVDFEQDTCTNEMNVLVPCVGAWRLLALHGDTGNAGVMLYACRAEDAHAHPGFPQERYVETSFAIIERGEGWTELTHQAWLWSETNGEMHRRFRHELTYPGGAGNAGSEQVLISSKTTLKLFEATANPSTDRPLRSVEELHEDVLDGTRPVPYLLDVSIEATGDFASFEVSEQGKERFVIPVVLEREGDFLSMTAQIEGSSDVLAWEEYLQQRGINQRYVALGAVFSLSFSRTLMLSLDEPGVWSSSGAWIKTATLCELYESVTPLACPP